MLRLIPDTLIAFLRERNNERRAIAEAVPVDNREWHADVVDAYDGPTPIVQITPSYGLIATGRGLKEHIAYNDPAFVLRECDAFAEVLYYIEYWHPSLRALLALADPWRDHPDFPGATS